MKTILLLTMLVIFAACESSKMDEIISTDEFNICLDHSVERRGDYYFVQYDDSIGITFLYELDEETKEFRIKDDFRTNILKEYKHIYDLNDPSVEEELIKKATQLIDLLNKYNLHQINGWNLYFDIIEIYINESDFIIYSKKGKGNINKYLEKFPEYKVGVYLNDSYYKVD